MNTPSNEEVFAFLRPLKNNPKAVMVIVAGLFFLDAAFLLRGQFSQVAGAFAQARKLKTEYRSAVLDIKYASTYQTRLDNLKMEESQFTNLVQPEGNIPALLETVSKFADMSGVRVIRMKPMIEAQGLSKAVTITTVSAGEQKIFRANIVLTARAGFHQLGRFVAFLENARSFYDISNIEIRTDEQDYMRQVVTMIIEVAVSRS